MYGYVSCFVTRSLDAVIAGITMTKAVETITSGAAVVVVKQTCISETYKPFVFLSFLLRNQLLVFFSLSCHLPTCLVTQVYGD